MWQYASCIKRDCNCLSVSNRHYFTFNDDDGDYTITRKFSPFYYSAMQAVQSAVLLP